MSTAPIGGTGRKGIKKGLIFHFLLKNRCFALHFNTYTILNDHSRPNTRSFLQKTRLFGLILHNWSLSYAKKAKTGGKGCIWSEILTLVESQKSKVIKSGWMSKVRS
ncbi:hypothetical protein AM493_14670 [Flavobacterium akiainvivens]|uniref:Uncharacterized protein n=1 Tax=Flavobacterium akiainvivens TaxID=1202724 RepID=A0A0M8MEF1_9FLAO|nr:hypothetical protein AM493_14670 [Flavobacterium akiainvivens]SFQ73228.1 hypothetical protein SAMN05444144_11876 [Flavobacterium akiainvivens]